LIGLASPTSRGSIPVYGRIGSIPAAPAVVVRARHGEGASWCDVAAFSPSPRGLQPVGAVQRPLVVQPLIALALMRRIPALSSFGRFELRRHAFPYASARGVGVFVASLTRMRFQRRHRPDVDGRPGGSRRGHGRVESKPITGL
jgi:hypothetical protein